MEKITYTTLIIDDHPLIAHAYKTAMLHYEKQNANVSFDLHMAEDCDSALSIFENFQKKNDSPDIVFLDINLPPSKNGEVLSGEDLGIIITENFQNARIIVSTTYNDNFRVHSLLKNINPDGFLIKNDINPKGLLNAIDDVIHNPPFYSNTVLKLLRNHVTNDLLLDNIDRKILYELSKGTRTKDIPNFVPLSLAGVEKRKRHLKEVFSVKGSDDRELVIIAKDKGFI